MSTDTTRKITTTKSPAKHETLTRLLRDQAVAAQIGDKFPSHTEIMRQFSVSDRTALRSLDDLQREGWIVRRQGVGTFVSDPARQSLLTTAPMGPNDDSRVVAAVIATASRNTFYTYCLDRLTAQTEALGLSLLCHHFHQMPVGDKDTGLPPSPLPLLAVRPRGFVLLSHQLAPVARFLQEQNQRTVILGAPPAETWPDTPCIYGDHEQGGYLAARHLLDWGHERIAFASGQVQPYLYETLRWRGHCRALDEARTHGKTIQSTVIAAPTLAQWRDAAQSENVRAYFARPDAPTALAAWNDTYAVSLLRILHGAGLRVPRDVSVVGFDALPEGENTIPPLTTVDQSVERQITTALDWILRPDAPPLHQSLMFAPTLISRASCASP